MRKPSCVTLALILGAGCGGNDPSSGPFDAPPADGQHDGSLRADGPIDGPIDGLPDGPLIDARPSGPVTLTLNGAIAPVHDPSIIAAGGQYYVFATGTGLPIRTSTDLVNWSLGGQVFASKPEWITTTDPQSPNTLWAPDVSFFGGQYHLYYAASSFGSNNSCIGHATTPAIGTSPWVDQGSAVICSNSSDNWNALDPAAVIDTEGNGWLAFGSFWGGLKLIRIDVATGARQGTDFISLATRANTAVEASFIIHHGDSYYLFESVDFCCRGVDSTYKIMVGRSPGIEGPYVDHDGTTLLSGGGTLVLEGDARWRGPGHNAILHLASGDYNIYHSYDANANGLPTLRISELFWSADGWPISAGP